MNQLFENTITQVLAEDEILSDLNLQLRAITAKIHARQNDLVLQEKQRLNISGTTEFEACLFEAQMGIH